MTWWLYGGNCEPFCRKYFSRINVSDLVSHAFLNNINWWCYNNGIDHATQWDHRVTLSSESGNYALNIHKGTTPEQSGPVYLFLIRIYFFCRNHQRRHYWWAFSFWWSRLVSIRQVWSRVYQQLLNVNWSLVYHFHNKLVLGLSRIRISFKYSEFCFNCGQNQFQWPLNWLPSRYVTAW